MGSNDKVLEWELVDDFASKKSIGAVGFVQDKAAVVVAFYDDRDWNNDGKVDVVELVASKTPFVKDIFFKSGRQLTSVWMQARGNPDIVMRDSTFNQEAARQFLDFASGLVFSGLYLTYFSKSIADFSSSIAAAATESVVKQYVIRKGMEKAVETVFKKAVDIGVSR